MTLDQFREKTRSLPGTILLVHLNLEADWYTEVQHLEITKMERFDESAYPPVKYFYDVDEEDKDTLVIGLRT